MAVSIYVSLLYFHIVECPPTSSPTSFLGLQNWL